jgi:putative glutathione S-transferase
MGLLIDGVWHDRWYDTKSTSGRFERQQSRYRNWVTADGAAGPSGEGGFAAEPGRYHLYVSLACPWAQRTLIYRALKGLEALIPLSVVHWRMLENGWTFEPGPGVIPDPIHHADYLYQVYQAADPAYTGRVTTPVLWDRRRGTIVNNESADIIRMFNSAFDRLGARAGDYYPVALREEIDALNARIYETVNNGVYRAGFATSQSAYEEALRPLFETLEALDGRLANRRFLCGAQLTEADLRLLPTLLRFDLVYYGHFKCNLRRLVDFPNLWAYTRDVAQTPGVLATFNAEHAKRHYYESHRTLNPSGIVPLGPVIDFAAPHGREHLGAPR